MVAVLGLLVNIGLHTWGGEDSYARIHDNLDASMASYELLHRADLLLSFSNESVDGMLGGLPAHALMGIWGYRWLRSILPPFEAYALMIVLQKLAAFAGMFWLAYSFLVRTSPYRLAISAVVSMAFATLPFWPFGGMSVAGLPLVTAIIWDGLGRRLRIWALAALFSVSFFSWLSFTWLFFIPLAALILVAAWYGLHRGSWVAWAYLVAFTLFLGAMRWIEVSGTLLGSEPTIRAEFLRSASGVVSALMTAINFLIHGQSHAHSLHYLVLPISLVGFGIFLGRTNRLSPSITLLLGTIVAVSLIYGLFSWSGARALEVYLPILGQVNWSRIHWLSPLFWWALCALALQEFGSANPRLFSLVLTALMIGQLGLSTLRSDPISTLRSGEPTFRQFFAEELFASVQEDIAARSPGSLAVAVGLHPGVLQFNGIPTLDGYSTMAPLSKKRLFERILAPELAKNESLRRYIGDWGGRLYVFSADLTQQSGTHAPQVYKWNADFAIHRLEIDMEALAAAGAPLVVAALPIGNSEELSLDLVRTYVHADSAWDVWLYLYDPD